MLFDEKFAKLNGLSRSALSQCGGEALLKIIKSATAHDVKPEIISFATFGLFVFFTATDGSVDQAELDLYNSFGGNPVDGDTYAEMASKTFTEDGAKAILVCVHELLKLDPSLKDAFAELAMIAIVVNGEITQDEKDFFVALFK